MSADDGELLVLIGESGCGKTTTLKMINRLVEPTSGTISVAGVDVSRVEPVELRRSIGYVFQGVGLFPHMTVAENIGITPRLLGWDEPRVNAQVDRLLEAVHLPRDEFVHRWPADLSGGEQQRVGFARALAAEPRIILLDEPFGALDPLTRDALQREFREIQKSLGVTAILVTHDMTEALLLADRILVMRNGCIVQQGTPHELVSKPADKYVSSLLAAPLKYVEKLEQVMRGEAHER